MLGAGASIAVSIHSPRRSEGRLRTTRPLNWILRFQSTPPAEARGDAMRSPVDERVSKSFQSTPPAEARGDTCAFYIFGQVLIFLSNLRTVPRPVPKLGPFEIGHKSAA